jgi:mannan endo-1,4-beta-mannosidase
MVEHADWLYFCPWYDTPETPFVSGEKYQDHAELKALYNSDYCITLDELPADLFKGGTAPVTTTTKTSPSTTTTTSATTAKLPDVTLLGDANLDKKVSVADAVAILQAIANKDKYALKPQGAANADCYDPGDGVTANDALAIQKLDAKSIEKLPERSK